MRDGILIGEGVVLDARPASFVTRGLALFLDMLTLFVALFALLFATSGSLELVDPAGRIELLIVTDLDATSDAYQKGMREGDIIAEVGQEAVTSPKEMQDRVEAAEQAGRNSILLLVRRDGQPRFVALALTG